MHATNAPLYALHELGRASGEKLATVIAEGMFMVPHISLRASEHASAWSDPTYHPWSVTPCDHLVLTCLAQASILQYARRITEAATEGQPAVDCVIAVPPWFGPAQRQALLDAGQVFAGCPASRKLVERRHLS